MSEKIVQGNKYVTSRFDLTDPKTIKYLMELLVAWAVSMNYTADVIKRFSESLVRDYQDKIIIVTERYCGEEVWPAGFLLLKKVVNIIHNKTGLSEEAVFVHPLHRKNGLGRMMIEFAEKVSKEEGVDYIYFSPSIDGGSMDIVATHLMKSGYSIQMYGLMKEV